MTTMTDDEVRGWMSDHRKNGVHINQGTLNDLARDLLAARAERDDALDARDKWMNRCMDEVGQHLTTKAELARVTAERDTMRNTLERIGGVRGPYGYPFPEANPDYGSFAVMEARAALTTQEPKP